MINHKENDSGGSGLHISRKYFRDNRTFGTRVAATPISRQYTPKNQSR